MCKDISYLQKKFDTIFKLYFKSCVSASALRTLLLWSGAIQWKLNWMDYLPVLKALSSFCAICLFAATIKLVESWLPFQTGFFSRETNSHGAGLSSDVCFLFSPLWSPACVHLFLGALMCASGVLCIPSAHPGLTGLFLRGVLPLLWCLNFVLNGSDSRLVIPRCCLLGLMPKQMVPSAVPL